MRSIIRSSLGGVVITAGLLFASSALAQSVSETQTGSPPANATLTVNLNLTVEQAITLTLTGNASDPSTTFSGVVAGTSANVNFGSVNTGCSALPTTGQCHRLNDNSGARFVATIDAQVTVSGDATPTYDLGVESAGAVGVADQLYRVCGGNGSCPASSGDTFWTIPANGTTIPAVSGGLEIASGQPSGSIFEHQLALEILDSQAAGPLSVAVNYIARPN